MALCSGDRTLFEGPFTQGNMSLMHNAIRYDMIIHQMDRKGSLL